MAEEMVTLYDDQARPVGQAPRSVMRRENLRHGGTGILVTNSAGQVYVHRRTALKDVYPGYYDFAAGGVIAAGEEPDDCARRELAEELGVAGVELESLGEYDFVDERLNLHAWLYRVRWDGPITHQASEVAWGGWLDVERLEEMIADPDIDVMPDAVALWRQVGILG
ncbi:MULTISPECIES: NUDIX domain-containing protein [unclassified Luteococcus]|uniref:NUDIX domain-containing protein n=1 Tax=unclassified Luteococcus TaxID=2639923 RepID=UPI00313AFEBA